MNKLIVAGEIVKIHHYLTKAPRLRYMAGGSILIETFSTSLVPELSAKCEQGSEIYLAAAGRFMVGFQDKANARQFIDTIRYAGNRLFGDGISLVCGPLDSGGTIIKDVADALDGMKTRVSNRSFSAMVGLQYMRRCDECGAWGAEHAIQEGSEALKSLCRLCFYKYLARNNKAININVPSVKPVTITLCNKDEKVTDEPVRACYPDNSYHNKFDSFEKIAQESDTPYIGVFYADGNEMGTLINDCKTLVDYQEFSSRISTSNVEALEHAVAAVSNGENRFNGLILIKGGDDLLAVLPADRAVDFALAFMEKAAESGSPLEKGICGGLVFAPPNMPFTRLSGLADELCTSAKNKIWFLKKNQSAAGQEESLSGPISQSALDFMLVTSSLVAEMGEMAERQVVQKQNNEYTLFSARPYRLTEFRKLVEKIRELKKIDPPLPRRTYMDLKEIFQPGELKDSGRTDTGGEFIEFNAFVERMKTLHGKNQKAIEDFFKGYILNADTWKTRDGSSGAERAAKRVWQADIVELVDFINTEGGKTP